MNNRQQNYFIYYNTEDKAYFFLLSRKNLLFALDDLTKLAEN